MKLKFTLFRRGEVYYSQDSATGKQTSLRTKDEAEARNLLHALNEAQRQPTLNLHLARAYLTGSDPAYFERTWQTVMEQMQARGQTSSRERYATAFQSPALDGLRSKKLLETTADDFFAAFRAGKPSTLCFLRRLHHVALSAGWITVPIVAPNLWPKYKPKERRGIAREEHETILVREKKAEWKLYLELLWETGAAQADAANFKAEDIDWQTRTITSTSFHVLHGSLAMTMYPVADNSQLWQPTMSVDGTISESNYAVWVNGVPATVYGNYWIAENIPVSEGGVAIFEVTAYPPGEVPSESSGDVNPQTQNSENIDSNEDKPPYLYVEIEKLNEDYTQWTDWEEIYGTDWWTSDVTRRDDYTWENNQTSYGHGNYHEVDDGYYGPMTYDLDTLVTWGKSLYPNISQPTIQLTGNADPQNSYYNKPFFMGNFKKYHGHWELGPRPYNMDSVETIINDWDFYANTTMTLQTGGKGLPGLSAQQNLFCLSANAESYLPPNNQGCGFAGFKDCGSIPVTAIEVAGKNLGEDGKVCFVWPDSITRDVTPLVKGKDFYKFFEMFEKHKFKSYTWHPALTDTKRDRLQVGVGEEVSVYFDPPLSMTFPEDPWWVASAGGIEPDTGSEIKFTAPSNAATANIRVYVRDVYLDKIFTVKEPSGYDKVHTYKVYDYPSSLLSGLGQSGAGMYIRVYVTPTDVSFYRVKCVEVGENATGTTGYYADTYNYTNPPVQLSHSNWGADKWFQIFEDNSWQNNGMNNGTDWDRAYWSGDRPYPDGTWGNGGSFTWQIPAQWRIDDDLSTVHTNLHFSDQTFILGGDGTMMVLKFGLSAKRSPWQ